MSYVLHFCYNVFFEPFIKIVLGTDSRGAGRSFFEYVLQFVVYPTGFLVVSELDMEHFDQTGAQVGVEDGGDGFDTAVEVAAHPVGRAHVYFGVAFVAEIPDAGVLQKTVDNAGDTDVTAV